MSRVNIIWVNTVDSHEDVFSTENKRSLLYHSENLSLDTKFLKFHYTLPCVVFPLNLICVYLLIFIFKPLGKSVFRYGVVMSMVTKANLFFIFYKIFTLI